MVWYTLHLPDTETNPNLAILFQGLEEMKREKETMVTAELINQNIHVGIRRKQVLKTSKYHEYVKGFSAS